MVKETLEGDCAYDAGEEHGSRKTLSFAYYFYARAWCEVCGPSASLDAEELRVGERLPLVGAAASTAVSRPRRTKPGGARDGMGG